MDDRHRAAKRHLPFQVRTGGPADATRTPAAGSEPNPLRVMLRPGRLDVTDRGYGDYPRFRDIRDARSSFLARVKDNTALTGAAERPRPPAAQQAGVIRDVELAKLGTDQPQEGVGRPVRLVIVRRTTPDGSVEELGRATFPQLHHSPGPFRLLRFLTLRIGKASLHISFAAR
jgi:hypothetical protein